MVDIKTISHSTIKPVVQAYVATTGQTTIPGSAGKQRGEHAEYHVINVQTRTNCSVY